MEAVGQPFNTAVAFGSEAQITLNRQGDLIYYLYVVIDLPAITACDAELDNCAGIVGTNQFPSFGNPCGPCAGNDAKALDEYIDDGYTDAGSVEKSNMLKKAKDRWLRDKYGACKSLECCEEAEDCPSALCPELGHTWAHWVNSIGQFVIRNARIVIGGSTIDTLYNDFIFMWEELTGLNKIFQKWKVLARNSRLRSREAPLKSRNDVYAVFPASRLGCRAERFEQRSSGAKWYGGDSSHLTMPIACI